MKGSWVEKEEKEKETRGEETKGKERRDERPGGEARVRVGVFPARAQIARPALQQQHVLVGAGGAGLGAPDPPRLSWRRRGRLFSDPQGGPFARGAHLGPGRQRGLRG